MQNMSYVSHILQHPQGTTDLCSHSRICFSHKNIVMNSDMYCSIQDSQVTIRYTSQYPSSDKTATK